MRDPRLSIVFACLKNDRLKRLSTRCTYRVLRPAHQSTRGLVGSSVCRLFICTVSSHIKSQPSNSYLLSAAEKSGRLKLASKTAVSRVDAEKPKLLLNDHDLCNTACPPIVRFASPCHHRHSHIVSLISISSRTTTRLTPPLPMMW